MYCFACTHHGGDRTTGGSFGLNFVGRHTVPELNDRSGARVRVHLLAQSCASARVEASMPDTWQAREHVRRAQGQPGMREHAAARPVMRLHANTGVKQWVQHARHPAGQEKDDSSSTGSHDYMSILRSAAGECLHSRHITRHDSGIHARCPTLGMYLTKDACQYDS